MLATSTLGDVSRKTYTLKNLLHIFYSILILTKLFVIAYTFIYNAPFSSNEFFSIRALLYICAVLLDLTLLFICNFPKGFKDIGYFGAAVLLFVYCLTLIVFAFVTTKENFELCVLMKKNLLFLNLIAFIGIGILSIKVAIIEKKNREIKNGIHSTLKTYRFADVWHFLNT